MAEVQLAATVGAVEKSVQRTFVPNVLFSAPAAFPHLMNGLPGVFINDGRLSVFRDDPVGFVVEHTLMGFVGYAFPSVAHGVPAVFVAIKQVQDGSGMPHGLGSIERYSFSFGSTPVLMEMPFRRGRAHPV